MATETAENYLKAIYNLASESPTGEAAMSRIAASVGVTTGTATTMVKKLAAARLARYERFGGVTLTPAGRRAALDILRRHRLIETFLVRTLELDWSEVHAEAERLEHAVSARVLEALDRFLGRPVFDPHGDPIPGADGALARTRLIAMSACASGRKGVIARVLDQREASLRFLRGHGLEVGSRVEIVAFEPGAGTVTVRNQRRKAVSLSEEAARRILVDSLPERERRAEPRNGSAAARGPARRAKRRG